ADPPGTRIIFYQSHNKPYHFARGRGLHPAGSNLIPELMGLKIGTIDKSARLRDRILPHWRTDGQMRDIRTRAKGSSPKRFPGKPQLLHHPRTLILSESGHH